MNKRLTKSNNKMVAGVCAGIAEYLGWDVTIVRAVYAVLSVVSVGLFPGLLLYIILMIVMPNK